MPRTLSRREALQLLGAVPVAAAATSTPVAAQPSASGALQIGMVSRHLQWAPLDQAIAVTKEAGFDTIEWNVRKGGHVPPERVEQDLPRVVEATRKAGMNVTMITTSIQDAQSPNAEAIIRTAAGLGIRYYRGGEYFRYDYAQDIAPQFDALRRRLAGLADLNAKHGIAMAYHTHSAPGVIGGNVWDFWTVIRDLDPKYIGFNYDTGHVTIRGGNGWRDAASAVRPFIRALAVKDFIWTRRSGRGGPGAPGGRGGPGGPGGPGGGAGRGPSGPAYPWQTDWTPLGEGQVDFPNMLRFLKASGFNGPINIQYEHSNLLGTDLGTWTLDITRERFLDIVKKDLVYFKAQMKDAGFA